MTDGIHGVADGGVTSSGTRDTARVTVDLDAISRNVEVLRRHAGSAAVMAVVKADAYGHGLLPCARAALGGGASWLGVAQLREAMALRDNGIRAPLLSWLHVPGTDFAGAIAADIDLSVSALWSLAEVADAARGLGRTARIHLKVDTGLGRNGAFGDDWQALLPAAGRPRAWSASWVCGPTSSTPTSRRTPRCGARRNSSPRPCVTPNAQ